MIRIAAFSDEAGTSVAEQIAALKRNRLRLSEVRSADGKNVSEFTDAEAKEARARFEGEGIGVWACGSPVGKADISEDFGKYLDKTRRTLEVTRLLGTDRLRAFSFFGAYAAGGEVIDRMNALVEVAAEYGVTVYHENEKDIYGDVFSRVEELRAKVPGLKFVCDPANYIQVGESGENIVRAASLADYLHVKDVVRATGELVPAGEGDGCIARIAAENDGKTFTVEPHLAVFDGYGKIDALPMKNKYVFRSNAAAFDCAVGALRRLLESAGYRDKEGDYVK